MRIRDWYFQGWERREDENGKLRFVYTGEVYRFPGGMAAVRKFAVLFAAALIALYALVALNPSAGGMWHWAAVPQLLEIIPLVYLLIGAVCLLRAKEPLTYRDYHASWQRMRYAALWSVCFSALMVAAEIAYFFAVPEARFADEILYFLGELALTALSLVLARYINKHPAAASPGQAEKE